MHDHPPIHRPNFILSVPYRIYVKEEPKLVNITIYIAVDDATLGGTPILNITGL